MKLSKFSLALLAVLISQFSCTGLALADGITVSPAEINVTFKGADSSKNTPITVSNSYNTPIHLVAEFKGIDVSRGLLIPSDRTDPGLNDSLHISQTDIIVPARSSKQLIVAVDKSTSLAPGGHYATLVLTQQTGSNTRSNLRASISIGLFIIRADGASANIQLQTVRLNGSPFAPPTSANLSFKNAGNVHATPRGVLTALSPTGALVAKGIINQDSRSLLPGKTFTDTVPLAALESSWRPERLNVIVQYRTGEGEGVNQQAFQRWYVPPLFILICVIIVTTVLVIGYALLHYRLPQRGLRRIRRLRTPEKP